MNTTIRSGQRRTTLAELSARASRAATAFTSVGATDGAGVALLLRNDFEFFEASIATRRCGAYVVPINWHFSGEEVEFILRDADTRVLVVHADLLEPVANNIPDGVHVRVVPTPPEIAAAYSVSGASCDVSSDHLEWRAWIDGFEPMETPASPLGGTMLYTSGTTGQPKGVRRAPLEDETLLPYYRAVAETFGIDPGMRAVMTGPLYHSAPNAYANVGLRLGCDLLLMPRFDAEELLRLIESERLTHMHMVPTMFVRLLRLPEAVRSRYDLSSLQSIVHGAAPCPTDVKRQMIDWWGPLIREYYGSTEGSLIAGSTSEQWLSRPGTVGKARSGARIEIQDDEGRVLPVGEVGEVYARLDAMPNFTYHKRDADRAAIERGGLLTNGDLGYLDEDGYLYLCDRKRDMIISGGVNIYPAEIEAVLIEHPSVLDCAVFGVPHPEFGESVACAIQRQPESRLDEAGVRSHLTGRIAKFKIPETIAFHESLPRQDNGKIYKQALREPYWADSGRRI